MAVSTEHLYRRYGPMVLRRCEQLLKDEERAQDVAQDVFTKLISNEKQLEDRGLSSLLFRMATNESLNHLRSRSRRPEDSEGDLVERIAIATSRAPRLLARSSLGVLLGADHKSATIAVLHHLDGFTLEEVAAEVGMSVSGVRKRLRKLRADLQELEGGDE